MGDKNFVTFVLSRKINRLLIGISGSGWRHPIRENTRPSFLHLQTMASYVLVIGGSIESLEKMLIRRGKSGKARPRPLQDVFQARKDI